MKRARLFFKTLFFFLLILSGCKGTAVQGQGKPPVVATVNGVAIAADEVALRLGGHGDLSDPAAKEKVVDAIIAEEGGGSAGASGRRWYVDPLDGTREFGEPGRTDWAVHLALWETGELAAGAAEVPADGEEIPAAIDHADAAILPRGRIKRRPFHRRQGKIGGESKGPSPGQQNAVPRRQAHRVGNAIDR